MLDTDEGTLLANLDGPTEGSKYTLGPVLDTDEGALLASSDGPTECSKDGMSLCVTLGPALGTDEEIGLLVADGESLGAILSGVDGIEEEDGFSLMPNDGLLLCTEDGDCDGTMEGHSTSPNISSNSMRYEELKLAKFGQTSSILLSLIPSHDAIPRNGVSHGVVGIIRPIDLHEQMKSC